MNRYADGLLTDTIALPFRIPALSESASLGNPIAIAAPYGHPQSIPIESQPSHRKPPQ